MSKQKKPETTETDVIENPIEQVEQPETIETAAPDVASEPISEVIEPVVSEPESKPKPKVKINTVAATKALAANKKMGVAKFLSIYPQDIYIDTLLRLYYPHSFFTKDEWFQRIEEILNTPINN